MEYPKLTPPAATRQIIETFGGYNHNLRIGDGEFYDMQNMSSDHFPVLSPRAKRGLYKECTAPEEMIYKNQLFYIDSGCLHHKGGIINRRLEQKPEGRSMVSMGAYVVILPEGIWFNSALYLEDGGQIPDDKRSGFCDAFWDLEANVTATFRPCQASGEVYPEDKLTTGDTPPKDPSAGDVWLDTGSDTPTMKQWVENGDTGMWQSIVTNYIRIDAPGIELDFCRYDGVELSGLEDTEVSFLNGSNVIWHRGDDYIVIQGLLDRPKVEVTSCFTLSRTMPKMDFVVECGNRLWGCRYGENARGEFVNEIYCSKLGDFRNWSCFMGISTDSAAIQLGTDGPFTGAISFMGHPIFFKENVLHKVYISATGAHSVVETPCAGVQPGCGKSLAVVGDTLFYKSRSGIMSYDGSVPVVLPPVFGTARYDRAVAGAYGDKYYLSMRRADGSDHLFVYDTRKGLWHREDGLQVTDFAAGQDKLYAVSGSEILILAGADAPRENQVSWWVQTGQIGISTPDRKYLSRLNVRLSLEQGGEASLYVQYDFSPRWEHLCTVTASDLRSFEIPIRPKRCDHMRLELRGRGGCKVYSFTKTLEQGSDVT